MRSRIPHQKARRSGLVIAVLSEYPRKFNRIAAEFGYSGEGIVALDCFRHIKSKTPTTQGLASASEGFRAWHIRLYERPTSVKMVDIAIRLAVLGVLALIFRARIGDNGYFWLLCAELVFRALLMIKRPASQALA